MPAFIRTVFDNREEMATRLIRIKILNGASEELNRHAQDAGSVEVEFHETHGTVNNAADH